jgi:hypothetical protein
MKAMSDSIKKSKEKKRQKFKENKNMPKRHFD